MRRVSIVLVFVLVASLAAPAAASAAPAQYTCGVWHYVQFGQTLSSISRYYGVSVQAIAQANGIVNPNLIYAGQSLWIPCTGPYPPYPTYPTYPSTGYCRYYYTVQPGQTLSGIAYYYGVSPWSIAQANGIYNMNLIYAGQTLCIP